MSTTAPGVQPGLGAFTVHHRRLTEDVLSPTIPRGLGANVKQRHLAFPTVEPRLQLAVLTDEIKLTRISCFLRPSSLTFRPSQFGGDRPTPGFPVIRTRRHKVGAIGGMRKLTATDGVEVCKSTQHGAVHPASHKRRVLFCLPDLVGSWSSRRKITDPTFDAVCGFRFGGRHRYQTEGLFLRVDSEECKLR